MIKSSNEGLSIIFHYNFSESKLYTFVNSKYFIQISEIENFIKKFFKVSNDYDFTLKYNSNNFYLELIHNYNETIKNVFNNFKSKSIRFEYNIFFNDPILSDIFDNKSIKIYNKRSFKNEYKSPLVVQIINNNNKIISLKNWSYIFNYEFKED